MSVESAKTKPERLPDGAPLDYAPQNEQGVVYLFSHFAKKLGLHVEKVQTGFPDCTAYRDGKRIRIEFEFRSRNFVRHGHDPNKCDWIVCWVHDWPAVPERIRVVELRREFGLGFNAWFQPVGGEFRERLAECDYSEMWSVPSQAMDGDLILFYRTAPDSFVQDLFRIAAPVRQVRAGWKPGKDWMAPIKRVCTLKAPIHLSQLREHRVLKTAGFVRGTMQGRYRATEYWPELYRMILERNPAQARKLKALGPERVLFAR